ncbi:hypothetical protein ASE06_16250 [Sphingopyxis sp. Root214]|uniref:hypothetical protein n=1 Tax=unclassified Sphingopyxis TaxID=2614943 RepID=UPI0006F8479F|nr:MULTISPECIES: hypothetical protein [unclassified Sphingopyxis]KQZ73868.1 hypothetical protein ASD73_13905 [Sphingopyxis sp. Root154]KRC08008.1 hypothetical protein ASE06_16250 [Sphingopyxis sp. Root214]
MDIEIRQGLAEARALAAEHWRALIAYIGLGVLVPFLLLSSEPIFNLRTIIALMVNTYGTYISGSITGPLYLLGIVSAIVAGAMFAAWNAILAEFREGYISEIMYGMVAGAAYLIVIILLYFSIGVIATLPILLTIGIAEWNALAGSFVDGAYRLALVVLGTWIEARLCLTGAIMGAGGRLNPFSAIAESWRATGQAQWRLFGFYLAFGTVFGLMLGGLILVHSAVIWKNAQAPGSALEIAMSFAWILLLAAYFLGKILVAAGFLRAAGPRRAAAEVFA